MVGVPRCVAGMSTVLPVLRSGRYIPVSTFHRNNRSSRESLGQTGGEHLRRTVMGSSKGRKSLRRRAQCGSLKLNRATCAASWNGELGSSLVGCCAAKRQVRSVKQAFTRRVLERPRRARAYGKHA